MAKDNGQLSFLLPSPDLKKFSDHIKKNELAMLNATGIPRFFTDKENASQMILDEYNKPGKEDGNCHYCHDHKFFMPDVFGCCFDCYQIYWRD